MTRFISSIHEIIDQYDVILSDQWGVLHDGVIVYPGVIDAMQAVRDVGKPLVVVSNSGKRSAENMHRMTGLGVPRDLYVDLLTSGEATARYLNTPAAQEIYGQCCFLISNKRDQSMLRDVAVRVVETTAEASFMLMAGTDAPEKDQESYRPILEMAMAHALPAICSNPDFDAVHGASRNFGPGRLADMYQQMGGNVRRIGKPTTEIFRTAMALALAGAGVDCAPERVLMVGDLLYHDIAGAKGAGYHSLMVTTGLYQAAFAQYAPGSSNWHDCLQRKCAEADVFPDYVQVSFAA